MNRSGLRAPTARRASVGVIIPVLNEESTIGGVLQDLPREWVDAVVVVDNGCTDGTGRVARSFGARVVSEPRRGYGWACLAGMATLKECEVLVFLDGDHSDCPSELPSIVAPVLDGEADMVVGSRVLGNCEKGALTPQQRLGNLLTTRLMSLLFGCKCTDLGPFRAISMEALKKLNMTDKNYGWIVEMDVKAVRAGLRVMEVPVSYRKRAGGRSKVSSTFSGTVKAGAKMLFTVFKHALGREDG